MAGVASEADLYLSDTWSLESQPLTVKLNADALFRIQSALRQDRSKQPNLCSGGLLIGTCRRASSWEISVQEPIALEWDESRGGAPFLTEAQLRTLRETSAAWTSDTIVIGFYRASRAVEANDAEFVERDAVERRGLIEGDRSLLVTCCPFSAVPIALRLDSLVFDPHVFALWQDANIYELRPAAAGNTPDRLSDLKARRNRAAASGPSASTALMPVPQRHLIPASLAHDPYADRAFNNFRIAGWVIGTVIVSVLTYMAAHIYVKPMLLHLAANEQAQLAPANATNSGSFALGLRVNQNGKSLELAWDPVSQAIQSARSGKLVINDGALVREVGLDRNQLREGRLFYMPLTGDVNVRLAVTDADAHTVAESVQVFSGATAPSNPLRSSIPDINDPALLQADRLATLSDKPDDLGTPNTGALDEFSPPVPRKSQARSSAKSATPATVLSQVAPTFKPGTSPELKRDLLVSVAVKIDRTGRVTAASPMASAEEIPEFFVDQAVSAARLWRFSPAKVEGKPVASEMDIQFHFTPGQ
ncbi:MAG: energy transducer TonB [Acidobacteriaceae bacterium]|nr:energy transducer TonB [Acidobacteriaceae bacterium]